MYLTRFLKIKSICQSAFNGRPGGCSFGGQAVIGLLCKAFQIRGHYLGLKLRTSLVKGCDTFRIQTTQLSPDVEQKLSGLMSSRFSGEEIGELPLVPAVLSLFFPSFALSFATFSFKAFILSYIAKKDPTAATKCNTNKVSNGNVSDLFTNRKLS